MIASFESVEVQESADLNSMIVGQQTDHILGVGEAEAVVVAAVIAVVVAVVVAAVVEIEAVIVVEAPSVAVVDSQTAVDRIDLGLQVELPYMGSEDLAEVDHI